MRSMHAQWIWASSLFALETNDFPPTHRQCVRKGNSKPPGRKITNPPDLIDRLVTGTACDDNFHFPRQTSLESLIQGEAN